MCVCASNMNETSRMICVRQHIALVQMRQICVRCVGVVFAVCYGRGLGAGIGVGFACGSGRGFGVGGIGVGVWCGCGVGGIGFDSCDGRGCVCSVGGMVIAVVVVCYASLCL